MVQALDQEKNEPVAIRDYCSKDVSVANMEEAALTSQMKGKKYVESPPPTPGSPLIILKICLQSGVSSSKLPL